MIERIALVAVLGATLMACAPIPAPRVLDEADRISQSPAAREMKELAAPSWARAEKRRLEAHEALENGPASRAQFLAEEAIALYNEGVVLSRLAKATLREKTHDVDRSALDAELAELDAQQSRAAADVDAMEARLRALRVLGEPGGDGPQAEAARRDASRSFLVQAKLLCGAARALRATPAAGAANQAADDPTSEANLKKDLDAAEARIAALEASLADSKKPVDPQSAAHVRAECSTVLGRTRRAGGAKVTSGSADTLLEALSAMAAGTKGTAISPERDERGVVVVLRDVFDGDAIKAGAKERIADLDKVAAQNPRFPLAVVVHTDKPLSAGERTKWQARGAAILDALGAVKAPRKQVILAEDAMPLVSRTSPERAANTRVEIVFIAPEAL